MLFFMRPVKPLEFSKSGPIRNQLVRKIPLQVRSDPKKNRAQTGNEGDEFGILHNESAILAGLISWRRLAFPAVGRDSSFTA
jgi:hypothetical protein